MDDTHHNIQLPDSSYNAYLKSVMESLNKRDTDLSIITEDGEKIETQKSLICLYSKTVTSYLNSVPCCSDTNISLPISSLTLNNLLKVLIQGVVKANFKEELSEVAEAAKILGIDLQNINLTSTKDETNLYKACNVNTKPEPGCDHSEIKEEVEKKNTNKRENIKEIRVEHDDFKVYVEQSLQEDGELNQIDNLDELNWKESPKCGQCRKMFTNKFLLNQHMLTHTKDKPLDCDHCGKMFTNEFILKQHKDKPFDCDQCEKMFISRFILKQHMLTHSKEKPFDCKKCGNMYSRKSVLERHMFIHTKERPFSCDNCGNSFNSKYLLIRHEMSHTMEKPFSCNQCEKVFSRKDHQKRHHQRTHLI